MSNNIVSSHAVVCQHKFEVSFNAKLNHIKLGHKPTKDDARRLNNASNWQTLSVDTDTLVKYLEKGFSVSQPGKERGISANDIDTVSSLFFDFDKDAEEPVTFISKIRVALKSIFGYEPLAIVYTTPSHDETQGVYRYRLILPLESELNAREGVLAQRQVAKSLMGHGFTLDMGRVNDISSYYYGGKVIQTYPGSPVSFPSIENTPNANGDDTGEFSPVTAVVEDHIARLLLAQFKTHEDVIEFILGKILDHDEIIYQETSTGIDHPTAKFQQSWECSNPFSETNGSKKSLVIQYIEHESGLAQYKLFDRSGGDFGDSSYTLFNAYQVVRSSEMIRRVDSAAYNYERFYTFIADETGLPFSTVVFDYEAYQLDQECQNFDVGAISSEQIEELFTDSKLDLSKVFYGHPDLPALISATLQNTLGYDDEILAALIMSASSVALNDTVVSPIYGFNRRLGVSMTIVDTSGEGKSPVIDMAVNPLERYWKDVIKSEYEKKRRQFDKLMAEKASIKDTLKQIKSGKIDASEFSDLEARFIEIESEEMEEPQLRVMLLSEGSFEGIQHNFMINNQMGKFGALFIFHELSAALDETSKYTGNKNTSVSKFIQLYDEKISPRSTIKNGYDEKLTVTCAVIGAIQKDLFAKRCAEDDYKDPQGEKARMNYVIQNSVLPDIPLADVPEIRMLESYLYRLYSKLDQLTTERDIELKFTPEALKRFNEFKSSLHYRKHSDEFDDTEAFKVALAKFRTTTIKVSGWSAIINRLNDENHDGKVSLRDVEVGIEFVTYLMKNYSKLLTSSDPGRKIEGDLLNLFNFIKSKPGTTSRDIARSRNTLVKSLTKRPVIDKLVADLVSMKLVTVTNGKIKAA